MQNIDIWQQSLAPGLINYVIMGVYLIVMLLWALQVRRKNVETNPAYHYYTWGLLAKVVGSIAMGLIYTQYYEGGDTTAYFVSSKALVNLLFDNPNAFLTVIWGEVKREFVLLFTHDTGVPIYFHDSASFNIVRITTPFTILGFKDYFTTNILFAWFFFNGYWKFFLLLNRLYPNYTKAIAFSVLFFPSIVFWGSGISKDTISLSMTGWMLYSFYHAFIIKEKRIPNYILTFVSGAIVVLIKPYILVALIPGILIWLGWTYLRKLDNIVVRLAAAPLLSAVFLGLGIISVSLFGGILGEYGTLDGIIDKALITYEDHRRVEQYGHNVYDLGEFDGTVSNFITKAPLAITTGLFRPFLWEVRNPVMLLAALENFVFLIMVLVILWRTGFVKSIKTAFDEPYVIFALSFSIVFAFAVGISSANFGALVRLKIPLIPFLASSLFVLFYRSQELKADTSDKTLIISENRL